LTTNFDAPNYRHDNVTDHHIWSEGMKKFQRLSAIRGRGHDITFLLQEFG
jgi:hypothetical protein